MVGARVVGSPQDRVLAPSTELPPPRGRRLRSGVSLLGLEPLLSCFELCGLRQVA